MVIDDVMGVMVTLPLTQRLRLSNLIKCCSEISWQVDEGGRGVGGKQRIHSTKNFIYLFGEVSSSFILDLLEPDDWLIDLELAGMDPVLAVKACDAFAIHGKYCYDVVECFVWYNDSKSASEVGREAASLPAGYSLTELTGEDAVLVNDMWKYKDSGSVHRLRHTILSSPSAGIKDEGGSLISWALCRDGTVGNVFTMSSHQRKGFSSIVVRSLVKSMADRGIHAICDIVLGNDASEALFTKFNFTKLEQSHWTYMFNESFEVKDFNELRDRCNEVLGKYEWRSPLDGEWGRVYDMIRRGYTMNEAVVSGVEQVTVTSLEDLRSRDVMLLCPKGFQGYLGCYIGAMEVVILAAGSRKKGFEHLMALHYERYAS